MSASELLAVRDKDFFAHNVEFYKEILDRDDMADVTVACDDNHTVSAHRVILSASSLFFRSVIKKSKHPHPYIYLKGVTSSHLDSLMKYIYSGETEVRSEDFAEFMSTASQLKIISLTSTNSTNNESKSTLKKQRKRKDNLVEPKSEPLNDEKKSYENNDWIDEAGVPDDEGKGEDVVNEDGTPNENEESKLGKITEETEKIIEALGSQGKIIFSCKVCKKTFPRRTKARIHAETHLSQFIHKCPECDLESRTRSALYVHMRRKHSDGTANDKSVIWSNIFSL